MPNIITHTLFAQEIFLIRWMKTRMIYLNLDFTYWKLVRMARTFLFFHGMNPKDFLKKSDLRGKSRFRWLFIKSNSRS